MREVNKVNSISRIKPLPRIFPARERSPCPSAIAANGAPPPPTIAEKEQEQFRMKVVKLDGITHSNMGENGTEEQHNLINQYIYGFLTRR